MNKYILLAMLSLSSIASAQNTLTEQEKKEGWQLLFDGKTIEHWRNFKKDDLSPQWVVKDGAMVKLKKGGDIVTKEKYENFDFKMEWKIAEGGNSGIFILANETDADKKIYSRAPELQILDNERHSDRKLATHRSGSLYDMIAAPAASQKKAGEWNTVRIRFVDRHLKVWQNGVVAFEVKLGSPEWQKALDGSKFKTWKGFGETLTGHIGIQEHGDQVSLRNLRILKLPATAKN
ncbi:glycosyl hydrolase [Oceaniferula spumae]|uniref:Glycosyl hydrolase n=1 Tax=Oceaniferula spumae TaxID=2979115 RepID=A0AAT9FPV9_9BACT